MNKLAVTILAGSLALGGLGLVNADDDRYEKRGYSDDKYEKHEYYKGKRCDHKGKYGKYRLERMTKMLGLSEEQASQIKAIQEKYSPEKQALRSKMFEHRKQLREAMYADTVDQAKVKQLAEVIGNLKTEKILIKNKMHNEVSQVLTKEQRMKRKTMHQHKMERHHKYKEGYNS